MKKFLAVITSALMIFSAACSPGSDNSSVGEDFIEIDAAKLPSKVDLRNFEGKNYVTPVKTQLFGDC